MAGLSGSSWALAPWIASGKNLATYQKELPAKIQAGLKNITRPSDIATIINLLIGKIANNQKLSSVDIYGALLANTLFCTRLLLVKSVDSKLEVITSSEGLEIGRGNQPR